MHMTIQPTQPCFERAMCTPHNTPNGSPHAVRYEEKNIGIESLYTYFPHIFKKLYTSDNSKDVCKKFESLDIKDEQIEIPVYKSPRKRYIPRSRNGPPSGKYWWRDNLGRYVAAGGILILDTQHGEDGVWVISEKSRRGYGEEYTDIGGRYHFDDGDIYATISREFREEMYNTDEIPYSIIRDLATSNVYNTGDKFIYRMVKGKYLCLIVHRKYLNPLKLDDNLIQNAKSTFLKENPHISPCLYRTEHIAFLPFKDVPKVVNKLSFRLNDILLNGPLRDRIDWYC